MKQILILPAALLTAFVFSSAAFADAGPLSSEESPEPLGQFPKTEVRAVGSEASSQGVDINFPPVKTDDDARMAKKFSWWPTDARPAPVKDEGRSGYWWWPQTPGSARPWGNQGFVYVRKVIFDYKSSSGEMKPSLVIKKVIKNVKVYFDFDKSALRDDAQEALTQALETMTSHPEADILITGNADVRGSEKHNLKLGEKRAANVKDFLTEQGLPEDRIRILSRGKLDAMAPRTDLVGMQKDRNAQFMIAEVEEVMIPSSQAGLYEDKKVVEERQLFEGDIKVDTREVTIQQGDTLWSIAKREYGDGRQWKRIYEFNKDLLPNPDRPKKGTKIKIPIE
ncbi:MAG: OmpA family protein [Candidatus Omnitrophica bacterium]|nr:OmpA family protein [Candidatus Omnitrophota bacterium]